MSKQEIEKRAEDFFNEERKKYGNAEYFDAKKKELIQFYIAGATEFNDFLNTKTITLSIGASEFTPKDYTGLLKAMVDSGTTEISAFAFQTGKFIEQLIETRSASNAARVQKLEAKILSFRSKFQRWESEEEAQEVYDEHFGIKTETERKA